MLFNSIRPIDRSLSGATTSELTESGSVDNKGLHRIPQSSSNTGTSASDCLVSYQGYSLGGVSILWEKQSVYWTAPTEWTIFYYIYIYIYIYIWLCECLLMCVVACLCAYVCMCRYMSNSMRNCMCLDISCISWLVCYRVEIGIVLYIMELFIMSRWQHEFSRLFLVKYS